MSAPVVIVPYDPGWPGRYERERELVLGALGERVLGIQHVGSTAVAGLAAKDIVDILCGVREREAADACLGPLAEAGFTDATPCDGDPEWFYCVGKGEKPHDAHLHLCIHKGRFWDRHLLFRDFLRREEPARDEYADLKQRLAARYGDRRMAYCDAKTGFIRWSETRARGIELRRMRAGDEDLVYATFKAWGKERRQYEEYLAKQARGGREVLLAVEQGRVAGYAVLTFESQYRHFHAAGIPEIVDLNVIGDQQGQGLGSALVYACERRAREQGFPLVGISVSQTPEQAVVERLYRRLGFEPDGHGVTRHDNELHLVKQPA